MSGKPGLFQGRCLEHTTRSAPLHKIDQVPGQNLLAAPTRDVLGFSQPTTMSSPDPRSSDGAPTDLDKTKTEAGVSVEKEHGLLVVATTLLWTTLCEPNAAPNDALAHSNSSSWSRMRRISWAVGDRTASLSSSSSRSWHSKTSGGGDASGMTEGKEAEDWRRPLGKYGGRGYGSRANPSLSHDDDHSGMSTTKPSPSKSLTSMAPPDHGGRNHSPAQAAPNCHHPHSPRAFLHAVGGGKEAEAIIFGGPNLTCGFAVGAAKTLHLALQAHDEHIL
uniref:Uncharacterized protein n=1 Tax=Mycena chlorophos TaxID=658473 RepID=A0ABQ0LPY3_MYCCL|nr:predicted protein [Mycena chlorophos]